MQDKINRWMDEIENDQFSRESYDIASQLISELFLQCQDYSKSQIFTIEWE